MVPFTHNQFATLEKTPCSPAFLQQGVSAVLFNSAACRCKVESVNPTTGEYRIVLTGTLDTTPVGSVSPNFNG